MHKPGKLNEVVDALSRKSTQDYVAALSVVESNFLEHIQEAARSDATYQKLLEQVKKGEIRKYWMEGKLLLAKGTGPMFLMAPFGNSS
ncbi:hypothetical protein F511_28095 [Dorcoceras hygrometricum]|uniref:Uncharacterized protein n=1 Tax=Dorcoceras hygrometricum TaxID=472368 RepID=A0A2Z7A7X4_9LAMI|nr:hypothetical protein F511_28095 [Dorcoceras hygrometricum]